jgi:mevalonate kinase
MERLEKLLPEVGRRSVSITSSVPRGVGFGSSAALCAALSSAALGNSSTGVWELAHELERAFHGTPSGIDTGLSLHGGVTAFRPRPPALPAWEQVRCAPVWLVVGAVPRLDNSAGLIRGIGERMKTGEPGVREALAGLGKVSVEAKQCMTGQTAAPLIARLADQAQAILHALGLSSPPLDALLDEGRRCGALGGKLSGAGGGGAFFLVCDGEGSARAVAARLEKAGHFAAAPRAVRIGEIAGG